MSRRSRGRAAESVQDGQIRFAGPVGLDTLPFGDQDAWIGGGSLEEGLDHARLADAGLAGQEDDLAAAAPGDLEACLEPLEHPVPANEIRRAAVSGARYACRLPGRAGGCRTTARRSVVTTGDAGDEPVPASVDGGDEPGRGGPITEDLADLAHAELEDAVAHRGTRPHGLEQGLLGHELAVTIGEAGSARRRPSGRGEPASSRARGRRWPGRAETEGSEADGTGSHPQGLTEHKVVDRSHRLAVTPVPSLWPHGGHLAPSGIVLCFAATQMPVIISSCAGWSLTEILPIPHDSLRRPLVWIVGRCDLGGRFQGAGSWRGGGLSRARCSVFAVGGASRSHLEGLEARRGTSVGPFQASRGESEVRRAW